MNFMVVATVFAVVLGHSFGKSTAEHDWFKSQCSLF